MVNALSDSPQALSIVSISYHFDLLSRFIKHIYLSLSNYIIFLKENA